MMADVWREKIRDYNPVNALEQENVLQELMQHHVLASLSAAGLFKEAIFQGGTCLRILYGMNRFSEDLDFLLKEPNTQFRWQKYLDHIRKDCLQEGIKVEVQDKKISDAAVKKGFVKAEAFGRILAIDFPFERNDRRKIRIKLEVDSNPPAGSGSEMRYITFPRPSAIVAQTLSSGFGTKAHALLCRTYVKGRDWYDFVWYVSKGVVPDLSLLSNALNQQGPWARQECEVSMDWFIARLSERIQMIDWNAARRDVQRFLPLRAQDGLLLWNTHFFLQQAEQLTRLICPKP